MSIDKWVDEQNVVYTHSGSPKEEDISTCVTIYINLKDIMLTEISQSKRDKYCVFPLIWNL